MFCRTFIFAFLAVGTLATFDFPEEYKKSYKSILTTVCKKAGRDADDAADKAEQLTNSLVSFFNCAVDLVDFSKLNLEITAAKSNGTLDEVSKKYCAKTPELKTCFHTLIDAASPCVESTAEYQIPMAKNGTDQFFDYICYNDGERITQFLTENGPDCLKSKTGAINACADTLETQVESSLVNLLSLSVTEKCRKFDVLTNCIFKSLESCTPPTPGNLLESLIGYLRQGSVCNDALPLPQ